MPGSGTRCRFRLQDVICPDPGQVMLHITPKLEVTGEIAFLSDEGDQPDRFAIVEVEGLVSPLIVPVECIEWVNEAAAKQERGRQVEGREVKNPGNVDTQVPELERAAVQP